MNNHTLKIYFIDSPIAPYDEHASGNILSLFNAAVLGQLLKTDEDFKLQPSLIEKFNYDFKQKTYILKLFDNIVFHNGRKATSKDLEFTLLRGFYSPEKSFYHTYMGYIDGIESIKSGDKFKSESISGIKIIDTLTISVKLSTENPSFLHALTNPYFSLVPIEEMNRDYMTWKNFPIGAGLYKVESPGFKNRVTKLSIVKDNVELPKNIEINQSSKIPPDIDVSFQKIEGFKQWISELPKGVRMIQFNAHHELGRDKNFKFGLNHLLSRDEVGSLSPILKSTDQVLPSHFWGRVNSKNEYNVKKAKEYFSKVPEKLKNHLWELQVFSSGTKISKSPKAIGDLIASKLKKYGFNFKVVPTTEKFPTRENTKSSPLRLNGKVSDYIDPLIMFAWLRKEGFQKIYHPTGELHDKYQKLYDEALNSKDMSERVRLTGRLSEFVRDNAIVIALAEEKSVYYYNPKKIESLGDQPQPLTLFLQNIRMK